MHAGIDYDTKAVHVVLLPDEGSPIYMRYELEGHDAFERARAVRDAMPSRGWWFDQGVEALGIEEQNSNMPKMRNMVQKLKVVQGAILSCLPRDLLVNPMAGPDWRKAVGLKGNATKEDVATFSLLHIRGRLTGIEFMEAALWPQDAHDAVCLALAVQKLTVPA